MKKNNPKYKSWLKRRLRSLEKKRKKNNMKSHISPQVVVNQTVQSQQSGTYKVIAPSNFSIKDNPFEVAKFFDEILMFSNKKEKDTNINFDMSRIEHVTADAIIYLLAVIKDLQNLGKVHHNHKFSGDLPRLKEAKEFFVQSGFLNYVKSNIPKNCSSTECVKIMSDEKFDQEATKKICDFVISVKTENRPNTRFLYVLINEMMLNTCQHAYVGKPKRLNKWYMYAQKDGNILKFTFLDIGQGIPSTVRKKMSEKFFGIPDSSIIASALEGEEIRSNTGKIYRGKGLPKIKECVIENRIDNFAIISNKGFCTLSYNNDSTIKSELNNAIYGTIYYWEIR